MEPRSFDALARSLASPNTRRGLLAGIGALVVGARSASATISPCPIPGQTLNRKGRCTCPAGTDPCPNGCVDRNRDANNCGGCGTVCPADATCVKGECRCPVGGCQPAACAPGFAPCTFANPGACCSLCCTVLQGDGVNPVCCGSI